MSAKLYVGNLSFDATEIELQDLFSEAGTVQEAALMQDKFTGKSRGFAFVTMSTRRGSSEGDQPFQRQELSKAVRSPSTRLVLVKIAPAAVLAATSAAVVVVVAAVAVATSAAAVVVVAASAATKRLPHLR